MSGRRAARALVGGALWGMLIAGCASATGPGAPSPSVSSSAASNSGSPELVVEVFMPPGVAGSGETVPVVVLVPGGRWLSADPSGLEPLAEALAKSGSAVVTTTYRTEGDGASFPVPLQDVVCAVDQATQTVAESGVTPGKVVLVGHSAGAHLAALAALVGDQYQDGCSSPPVTVDGFIGLAGPYDIVSVADLATGLVDTTPTEDPETWRAANPMAQVTARPDLPVLLIHGTADTEVAPAYSKSFAAALEAAGHEVALLVLPGVDHFAVAQAANAADPLQRFVAGLAVED